MQLIEFDISAVKLSVVSTYVKGERQQPQDGKGSRYFKELCLIDLA